MKNLNIIMKGDSLKADQMHSMFKVMDSDFENALKPCISRWSDWKE